MHSAAWAVVLSSLFASHAFAHQKSVSYSKWVLGQDDATVQARVSWFDLTSLPEVEDKTRDGFDPAAFVPYLEAHLVLFADADACSPIEGSSRLLPAERGWMRVEWRVRCSGLPTSLRSDLFPGLANHVHLATVLGTAGTDLVLSSTSPSAELQSGAGEPRSGFSSYVVLGIEHILTGWDHIAFLLLLIVIARRLREVVLLVTGFTVGHSITLAAASLGAVVPH
ncbi:MAG: HupE/UreJ family protein, partial [Myxococcota bacterium]